MVGKRKKIKKRRRKRLVSSPELRNILSWGMIVLFTFVAIGIYNFLLLPQIQLNGSKKIILNYKEKYVEKGYHASFLGKDLTEQVTVSGKVNSKKIGVYPITYTVKGGSFTRKVVRKVEVKDISAPTITFDVSGDFYVCPGKKLGKVKYQAYDNFDGDVTKKVKVTEKKDFIVYEVSDQTGNLEKVKKKIIYSDHLKPTIQLLGGDVTYTYVGDSFIEPGYHSVDNCDGDLTNKVKVSGNVDTSKEGEYVLKYSVSDRAKHQVVVSRKVVVRERGKNGTIYLTFDDGPREGTTNVILDILKEEGVKATFFVTNQGPDELIKRAYDEGHSIALHTASHDYSIVYSSVDSYFSDLLSVQDRVKRITGYESKIIRFPGGSSNTISRRYSVGIMSTLTNEVINRGFRYYDWNLNSGDAEGGTHTAEEIKNNVIKQLSKDRVNMVLMHDIKPYTRDALKDIIHYGKENGYTFDSILMETEMVTQRVNN